MCLSLVSVIAIDLQAMKRSIHAMRTLDLVTHMIGFGLKNMLTSV
jgi:hypothetical protein